MKPSAVVKYFLSSINDCILKYTNYLGDGYLISYHGFNF